MKIIITGGNGMLGRTLQRALADHELVIADLPDWDITQEELFCSRVADEKPSVIIHCAAMTKVDDCETNSALAYRLNEDGSRIVAKAAQAVGARLFAISTDYVFSGENRENACEWTEADTPRPQTVYGMSKFAGEQTIFAMCPTATILRIAWLYGAGGPSFVHTMASLGARAGDALKVVDDQRGNPTSTMEVARVIQFLLAKPDVSGLIHATCEGICTWCDFAKEIKRVLGAKFSRDIQPCTTAEFPRPAPRPQNSALKNDVLTLLGYRMKNWQDALREFLATEFATDDSAC